MDTDPSFSFGRRHGVPGMNVQKVQQITWDLEFVLENVIYRPKRSCVRLCPNIVSSFFDMVFEENPVYSYLVPLSNTSFFKVANLLRQWRGTASGPTSPSEEVGGDGLRSDGLLAFGDVFFCGTGDHKIAYICYNIYDLFWGSGRIWVETCWNLSLVKLG